MKCPPARPFLGATAGLVLCAGGAVAAATPPSEAPAPAPSTKPGWVSRVAGAPKKLAFWDKEKNPAAAPPAAAAAAPTQKKALTTTPKKTAASKKRAASAAPPAVDPPSPAESESSKKSFLSKLPALPFARKASVEPAPAEPASAASATGLKNKRADERRATASKPSAEPERTPPPAPEEDEKKAGFFELSRLWPAGRKSPAMKAPAAVADRGPATGSKRSQASAGQPGPPPEGLEAASAATGKPSLWSRMAAAVTSSSPGSVKPETTPVPKGLAQLGEVGLDDRTFVIAKDDSAFYTYGPQQATPPDAYLSTGTVVTLTGKNWGWATVQLPDGRTGVVDRGALRPALITDLVPSRRPGDALMASLSPSKIKGNASPNFILPAAEMPDLPTSGDAGASAPGNPLLLPFSPDDISDPDSAPPFPEIPPLPEPEASTETAPEPAAPGGSAPSDSPNTPAPAEPSTPEGPDSPAAPASEPTSPAE